VVDETGEAGDASTVEADGGLGFDKADGGSNPLSPCAATIAIKKTQQNYTQS